MTNLITCLRCWRRMSGVVVLRRVIPDERRRRKGELRLCSPGVITWLGRASMTSRKTAAAANTVAVHLGAVFIFLTVLTEWLRTFGVRCDQNCNDKNKNKKMNFFFFGSTFTAEQSSYSNRIWTAYSLFIYNNINGDGLTLVALLWPFE